MNYIYETLIIDKNILISKNLKTCLSTLISVRSRVYNYIKIGQNIILAVYE